ncbi:septum site-determining protein MinC [Sporomusa termitida]|uniref:Probable septum site-determining protein MinC n=1 Tax=Sporomusa termitida TaxID=2377 RepID=A0A517DS52_9FIRM|nr:septum site-determining protein MinC [Sporomusa termitida]QDR80126.1 Septum site-determining protein MinC [Sporomusa termitida]
MREDIVFKGNKGGLELVINESVDFTSLLEQLKEKLESAAHFFTGNAGVKVVAGSNSLTGDERRQLISLLADYGLALEDQTIPPNLTEDTLATGAGSPDGEIPVEYRQEPEGGKTLIVSRMLRGGQRIVFSGSVIIMGDVNPGAEIIAGGSITVTGTCRGVAHAGANGDQLATITADKLIAGQLRIAGMIARAPDNEDNPTCRETARIVRGIVVIEPADKVNLASKEV